MEKRYYRWLALAPAGTNRWNALIERLEQEGETQLLDLVRRLRPKEYKMASAKVRARTLTRDEFLAEARRNGLTAAEEARYFRDIAEGNQILLNDLEHKSNYQMALSIEDFTDEDMVVLMSKIAFSQLVGAASVADLEALQRMEKFAQNDSQRQLLKLVIADKEAKPEQN
jgi:hypothetical protein